MKQRCLKLGRPYQKEVAETPYLNGVKDSDGNTIIRPLSQEEFDFIEKFNNEYVFGNFERDEDGDITESNLHYDLVKNTDDSVKLLKDRIKDIKDKLNKRHSYRETNDWEDFRKYMKNLYKEYSSLKKELESVDILAEINNDNYARRNDVMTYLGVDERTVLITDWFDKHLNSTESSLFEQLEISKI